MGFGAGNIGVVIHGAATSSLHSEGAAPASDWSGWEAAGYRPPSGDGNGFATQYADDAALLASHGLGALRITLEWARLEPRRTDKLVADEVTRYRAILTAIRAAGLQAWACLAHTSLPGWFSEDERGFLDEGMARRVWPAHVDRVAEAFGDLVDGWVTFHEPVRYALDAWLLANLPPGRRDGDDARSGLRLLQAADAEAARLLRVPGGTGAPVASCQWLPPLFPLEPTPECRAAVASASTLLWDTWRELDVHDWLGVSCSYALGVDADGSFHPWPATATPNPLGWAAWPDAIGHTLQRVGDERSGRPVLLLTGVSEASAEIVAESGIEQVHWWSAVDGYETAAGFGLRTGLFDRDRNPTGITALGLSS